LLSYCRVSARLGPRLACLDLGSCYTLLTLVMNYASSILRKTMVDAYNVLGVYIKLILIVVNTHF